MTEAIHPDVNSKIIVPILESIETTLNKLFNVEVERGKMYVLNVPFISMGIGAIIKVSGDYNGKIFLDMLPDAALKIVEKCLNVKNKIDDFNNLVIGAVGEVLNIIAGNISNKIEEFGNIKVSSPVIISKFSNKAGKIKKNLIIIPLGFDKYIINVSFYIL